MAGLAESKLILPLWLLSFPRVGILLSRVYKWNRVRFETTEKQLLLGQGFAHSEQLGNSKGQWDRGRFSVPHAFLCLEAQRKGMVIKMKYHCIIIKVEEEEITVRINNVELVCFCGQSTTYSPGDKAEIELYLYDNPKIDIDTLNEENSIIRLGMTYSYQITGILDAENKRIRSVIDFPIDDSIAWDFFYLNGTRIKLLVHRIDLSFCGTDY